MASREHLPFVQPVLCSIAAALLCQASVLLAAGPEEARRILAETGCQGGLIVHVGCGDGELTTALRAGDGYLVHGLDTDADNVRQTRDRIAELGLQGKVTADTFNGRALPLIDNVVNLLVADDLGDVPVDEVQRVLCPGGVWVKDEGVRAKDEGGATLTLQPSVFSLQPYKKPRPENIDDWTHYLHDASNNAVAHDEVVGPPRHLQWQCGPRWSRHHDHMASVSAMVTAGGRVFSILDEGSRLSPQLPPDWQLVARDAFNGVLLWKRPIDQWFDALWPLKSGPASLPRRLVAIGDVVYVTSGINAPVTALEAATGETLRTYSGTEGAEEIIFLDGTLVVLVNRTPFDPVADLASDVEEGKSRDGRTTYSEKMKYIWAGVRSTRWANSDRSILALDAAGGQKLWSVESRVLPLTLAADRANVFFHDGEQIVALDRGTGRQAWSSEPVPVWHGLQGQGLQSWFAPTLVVQEGKVLFAGGEKTHMSYMGWGSDDIGQDTMTALNAATGEKLWIADHPYSGYNSPEDLFFAAGKVWTGVTAKGNADGRYIGHNPDTGRVEVEFPPTVDTHWFHHRCYRAKATDRFVLCSRTGIELVDLQTGDWTTHHWVRGGCLYGIMPANGLIYSPPHPCACYPEAKLYGFAALAAKRGIKDEGRRGKDEGVRTKEERLERGPAYGESRVDSPESRDGTKPDGGLATSLTLPADTDAAPSALDSGLSTLDSGLATLDSQLSTLDSGLPTLDSLLSALDSGPSTLDSGLSWPTHRHDAARSGATHSPVATDLKSIWETELGGRLSQPITGGGLLYVADAERHLLHGLDAGTGKRQWTFQAGGPIDSSPTYHGGRLLFGSADGYVYCLRADDGEMAWRFLAAPIDRRMVAFEQLESVWPVHGSVLVQNGIATFVAGRSMYLDGGLRVCRLAVDTGQLLRETVLDDRDPETGDNLQVRVRGLNMPVALPDILSSDGEHLFMRSQVMDLAGNRLTLGPSGSGHPHLFAPYGFTDDSWFHRTYWVYGDSFKGGVGGFGNGKTNPAGRILVNNETTVFGYGRKPEYYRWGSAIDYQLYAADIGQPASAPEAPRRGGRGKSKGSRVSYRWTRDVPLMVRAMAAAGDKLLIAGPVDVLDEDKAFQSFDKEDTQQQLLVQDAALRGESGGMFQAVDAETGETLAELRLDAPPVFDGLSVAAGRVFLASVDGRIVCLGK